MITSSNLPAQTHEHLTEVDEPPSEDGSPAASARDEANLLLDTSRAAIDGTMNYARRHRAVTMGIAIGAGVIVGWWFGRPR